jgi:hypothetical protein
VLLRLALTAWTDGEDDKTIKACSIKAEVINSGDP